MPMSGATTERRSDSAIGSRICAGSTMTISDAMTATTNNATSMRLLKRAARATSLPSSGAEDGPVLLFVVEDPARPSHHARQWIFIHLNRQTRLLPQQQIETANERAAARHDDAAVDDVARELRRCDLERATHGVDDLLNRFLNRLTNLARVHAHRLRNA